MKHVFASILASLLFLMTPSAHALDHAYFDYGSIQEGVRLFSSHDDPPPYGLAGVDLGWESTWNLWNVDNNIWGVAKAATSGTLLYADSALSKFDLDSVTLFHSFCDGCGATQQVGDASTFNVISFKDGVATTQTFSLSLGVSQTFGLNLKNVDFVLFDSQSSAPGAETYIQAFSGNGLIAAVPEPATWATMLAGIAVLGGVARKRRQSASA